MRTVLIVDDEPAARYGMRRELIAGESGTGEDLLAQEIHARSAQSARPFVATAEEIGLHRQSLQEKLRELGIKRPRKE